MNTNNNPTSEARTIADLAQDAIEPRILKPGEIYLINGEGGPEVIDTDYYMQAPRIKATRVAADTPETFIEYLNTNCVETLEATEVWADMRRRKVVGILDAHAWRGHRVTLELQHTPEWLAWVGASGTLHDQATLADFIEDQLGTIAEPDGATLLEIVQSMQGTTKAEWKSAEWLDNGARGFQWVEEVEGKAGRKGTLEVPSRFTLGLRPFLGSQQYRVVAALRYRVQGGGLRVGFKLIDVDRVLESAFEHVVDSVAANVEPTIYFGQPD